MSYGQDAADLLRENAELKDQLQKYDADLAEVVADKFHYQQEVEHLRQKLAEAQEDTARLSYIIEESNKGNGWLGDDFWDRVAELCPVDWDEANDTQKWGRAAIDQARGKK